MSNFLLGGSLYPREPKLHNQKTGRELTYFVEKYRPQAMGITGYIAHVNVIDSSEEHPAESESVSAS